MWKDSSLLLDGSITTFAILKRAMVLACLHVQEYEDTILIVRSEFKGLEKLWTILMTTGFQCCIRPSFGNVLCGCKMTKKWMDERL